MKGDKEDSGEQHRPWRKILREETVQVSQIQIIYRGVCGWSRPAKRKLSASKETIE